MYRQEALKLLHEGHFDLAIPAALQSLRFSIDYYGQNSITSLLLFYLVLILILTLLGIDLVPSYLLLGEACVGLSRYN